MKKTLTLILLVTILLTLPGCDMLGDMGEIGEIASGFLGGLEQWKEQAGNDTSTDDDLRSRQDDFMHIGLGEKIENQLILLAEKGSGTITMGDYFFIVCENGDIIIDHTDDEKIELFTLADYAHYVIGDDNYTKTLYTDAYKKEYYNEIYLNSTMLILMEMDHSKIVADGLGYVAGKGLTLLPHGVSPTEDCNARGIFPVGEADKEGLCELWNYTEYTGKVNSDYLTTVYMHPQTRTFDWLHSYAEKVQRWSILYIEDIAMESQVTVYFNDKFTKEDSRGIQSVLEGFGLSGGGVNDLEGALSGLTPEQKAELEKEMETDMPAGSIDAILGALGEGGLFSGLSGFEGVLPIYQMPFKHEGDNWYDNYNMTGMSDLAALGATAQLSVEYLHKYWYDGGSFATYVRRKDGLYRTTGQEGMYVIDKDGNRIEYDYETGLPK